jgi:hypothetical protein
MRPTGLRPARFLLLVLAALCLARGEGSAQPTVQDFDLPGVGTPYTLRNFGGLAAAQLLSEGPGLFLRLAHQSHDTLNTVGFDRTAPGRYLRVEAEFDFRFIPAGAFRADGLGFALLNTGEFAGTGAEVAISEEPNLAKSIGVGFDIYQNAGEPSNNHVSVHADGAQVAAFALDPGSFDLASGVFHHAGITIDFASAGALVTVSLDGVLAASQLIAAAVPYESRAAFGARTGGEYAHHDLDNIAVTWRDLVTTPDLELEGGALFVNCGGRVPVLDSLGRLWRPDGPYLAPFHPDTLTSSFAGEPVDTSLLGDRHLPNQVILYERWRDGSISYQVPAPSDQYRVILYFSENWLSCVSRPLGGDRDDCPACARVFDIEVEGQRVDGYNQADAALSPAGDGAGRTFMATEVAFDVPLADGLIDIKVLDRGPGNPPENAAIKAMAIYRGYKPVTPLAVGTPVRVPLSATGRSCLFSFRPPAGRAVLLVLDRSPDAADPPPDLDWAALYVRWGKLPSPSTHDAAASVRRQVSQKLVLPATRDEDCYALVHAHDDSSFAASVLGLQSSFVELELEELSARSAGAGAGLIEAKVRGAGFDAATTFRLERSPGGFALPGTARMLFPDCALVTFDVREGAQVGTYDLAAEKPDPASPGRNLLARLARAFDVVPGGLPPPPAGPPPEVELVRVGDYRRCGLSDLRLRVKNVSDAEMPAPLVQLRGTFCSLPPGPECSGGAVVSGDADFGFAGEDLPRGLSSQVAVVDFFGGEGGRLLPHEEVFLPIAFRFKSLDPSLPATCFHCEAGPANLPGCRAFIEAWLFTPGAGSPIGWETLHRPGGMTDEDWQRVRTALERDLDASTWKQYAAALAEVAERLHLRGRDHVSHHEALRFAVRRADGRPSSALAGRVVVAGTGEPLADGRVVAVDGTPRSCAATDAEGRFAIDWLEAGVEYEIKMVDFDVRDGGGNEVAVTVPSSGEDMHGLLLHATPSPGNAIACDSPNVDERGLPENPFRSDHFQDQFTFRGSLQMEVIQSHDPNTKDGPVGQGEDPEKPLSPENPVPVAPDQRLDFTVRFENVGTAGVLRAVIEDELDPALDPATLCLATARFGEHQVVLQETCPASVESGGGAAASFEPLGAAATRPIELDVAGLGRISFPVSVEARFIEAGRKIRWELEAFPPEESADFAEVGFLAPRDSSSTADEGEVTFSIWPVRGLEDGTLIENQAEIQFDPLDPAAPSIETDTWYGRIESDLPPEEPHDPVPRDDFVGFGTSSTLGWLPIAGLRNASFDISLSRTDCPGCPPETADRLAQNWYRPAGGLEPGVEYVWHVVARNAAGETAEGPEWSFTTADVLFIRGDCNGDDFVGGSVGDPVFYLNWVFLHVKEPECLAACDFNGDGEVAGSVTDPVFYLNWAFLGTRRPPPPFPLCGPGSAADNELGCEAPSEKCL